MFVIKRNGTSESVQFDKITQRISKLINKDEEKYIDPILIAQKTIASIYNGISTEELDFESSKICINLCTTHYMYSYIASRILVSNLHKKSQMTFIEKENYIQDKLDLLNDDWLMWININSTEINSMIDYSRDYMFDYFGFKTLERAYLIKVGNIIIESPQDMFMRVASFINKGDLKLTKETYDLMSQGYYTHASPTLFNAGNKKSQLSSCFLMGTDDSLEGITKTWSDVSKISKWGGGIGLHVSNIRAKGSLIHGTNGPSNGIIPMLKVYNEIARYIDQCFFGSTKIYTEHGLVSIENIKPYDKVFTIDGSLQNIKRVYCDYYKGDMLNFTINNDYENIKVTSKHPFYVIKNQPIDTDINMIINRLEHKSIYPEWISAEDITLDDLVGLPIPKYIKDNTEIDDNDCYMYGLFLGYGEINENTFNIKFNNTQTHLIAFTLNYLKQYNITFTEQIINVYYQISWDMSCRFKFVKSQFYENEIKYINSLILHLPEHKNKFVIKGLIDTIGSTNNGIIIQSYIQNIIDGVKYILLKMGILCKSNINQSDYILNIPKVSKICELFNNTDNDNTDYFEYENILYTRLFKNSTEYIETNIYDLEIENNHNYLTQVGLVHNGGKRKGSIAIYLEPHHADVMAFLDLRKNFGTETERARDLFTSMWISDLFMKQVENDDDWYLMCPNICKGLSDVYGDEYETLYWKYVNENKYTTKMKARELMKAILDSQLETGTPYIAYKDSVNKKSNQKNIGTIKSSNLCIEILEYSDDKEYAVCNLASIAINKFIEPFIFNKNDKWEIYTKENCKYCTYAKTFLNNREILFTEIENVKCNSYPQIYYNDILIGGYDDLFDFVKGTFDYDKLYDTAYIATKNLNKIIDINYYPVPEAKLSNLKHRPIGLGIQGLADALVLLKIPFDSEESLEFNKKVMEIIYMASIDASNDISKERLNDIQLLSKYTKLLDIPEYYDPNYHIYTNNNINYSATAIYNSLKLNKFELDIINLNNIETFNGSYSTFEGSPFSNGLFQFDLWNIDPINKEKWDVIRDNVKMYGMRNSLLTALMPTASTSQILGNNECFEFFTNNIYTRKTLAGDFPLVNKYLIDDLSNLNLWSNEMKQMIIANNGSIANFSNIPMKIRRLYQTNWEIKQIWVLKNALARAPYVDQTQSMNIFLPIPDYQKLYSSHHWAWKNGLKTGIYYLRSKPSADATKFTVDKSIINKMKILTESDSDICEFCSA
jgi:ribonucleotide reductase alpha subunit